MHTKTLENVSGTFSNTKNTNVDLSENLEKLETLHKIVPEQNDKNKLWSSLEQSICGAFLVFDQLVSLRKASSKQDLAKVTTHGQKKNNETRFFLTGKI